MSQSLGSIGGHSEIVQLDGPDVNGREMFQCSACRTFTRDKEHFRESFVPCAPIQGCRNCLALSRSNDREVAVPDGGNCNNITHVCPHDGRRWWQSNTHFHIWQQVTDPLEWQVVRSWGEPGGGHPAWDLDK
jgi:hypothetical protein